MKSKTFVYFGIILLLSFQNLFSQRNNSLNTSNLVNYEPFLSGELFTSASNVELSTYLSSDWLSGDIYLLNGEIARNKQIKYNGLLDELLWLEPKSKTIIKLDKEAINLFHFQNFNGDTSVYFQKIKIKRNGVADSTEAFAEAVYRGIVSIYILHTFVIDRKELVETNAGIGEKLIYAEEPVYVFLTLSNKLYMTESLSRNNLYKFSPSHKEEIKQFCKENETGKFTGKVELTKLSQFLSTVVDF